jgi:hypothetical protein
MVKLFRCLLCGTALVIAVSGVWVSRIQGSTPALIVLNSVEANQAKTAANRIPPGWELKINAGQADISVADQGDDAALHFKSAKSSFGLERAVDVDPAQMPYLDWRWKVTELPRGGDFRHYATDDQAAQVMVAFTDRRIIAYLWDTTAPAGAMESASSIPLVHIFAIVCRSGGADANRWLEENRNIAADYQKAFGKPAPHVKGIRLQINSQHTGSSAESYFGEVEFRNAQS